MNTLRRLFLRKLKMELKIPVLALVDSDPYGLKILAVYMKGVPAEPITCVATQLLLQQHSWRRRLMLMHTSCTSTERSHAVTDPCCNACLCITQGQ